MVVSSSTRRMSCSNDMGLLDQIQEIDGEHGPQVSQAEDQLRRTLTSQPLTARQGQRGRKRNGPNAASSMISPAGGINRLQFSQR